MEYEDSTLITGGDDDEVECVPEKLRIEAAGESVRVTLIDEDGDERYYFRLTAGNAATAGARLIERALRVSGYERKVVGVLVDNEGVEQQFDLSDVKDSSGNGEPS